MNRLLVIGCKDAILEAIRAAPSGHDYEVVHCTDSENAVNLAGEWHPKLIVLDGLPSESFARRISEILDDIGETRKTPVLLHTDLTTPVNRSQALLVGADAYLAKPAEPGLLWERVVALAAQPTMVEANLQGSLDIFPIPEVLGILHAELKSGDLSVLGENAAGLLELYKGRIFSAFFEALHGREAVIAACSLENGRFEFSEADPSGVGSLPQGKAIGVKSVVQEIQWLQSELEVVGSFEPSRDEFLKLSGKKCPPIPPTYQRLPFDEVMLLFEDLEGLVLAQLLNHGVAADLRLRLVLAWLRSQGVLESPVRQYQKKIAKAMGGPSPPQVSSALSEFHDKAIVKHGRAKSRVLVVDDSSLMRRYLVKLYDSNPNLEVVGTARDGKEALSLLPSLRPDVISLDLFMPVLDGVETLKRIMLSQPTPTVVVTAGDPDDLDKAVEACMRFGALGFVRKPHRSPANRVDQEKAILEQICSAAGAGVVGVRMFSGWGRVRRIRSVPGPFVGLVVVSGGVGADRPLQRLLMELPADLPVTVVAELSLPRSFLRAFCSLAVRGSVFSVERAEEGRELRGGVCYLASRDERFRIGGTSTKPILQKAGKDSLFRSAVDLFENASMGILLSGEGAPPGQGLLEMRIASGFTLAQIPETCVHPEQTERARELELVDAFASPAQLAGAVTLWVQTRLKAALSSD